MDELARTFKLEGEGLPLDASLLLTRRMATLRDAFSLVPEYLRTLDREAPVRDYNEYTPQLGRRFRALQQLVKQRRMAKTEPVPCIVRDDDAVSAEEDSLAELRELALAAVAVQGVLFWENDFSADAAVQVFFFVTLAWGWWHWVPLAHGDLLLAKRTRTKVRLAGTRTGWKPRLRRGRILSRRCY